MFWQPALEERLEQALGDRPSVVVYRGAEVVGVEDAGAGVTLLGRDGPLVRAAWVVGCDGANSTVRSAVGAPVTDLGFRYDWLIVDVAMRTPRTFDPVNLQVCDPGRPTTLVSGGPGRRRWEFMRLPHEVVEELDDEATAWRLLAAWDVTPEVAVLERHAVYTFEARWVEADRWRTGRVLLAGDAAHQMPPFAGQGMCAGLRDAANLAWKLDLVLAGRAGEALLDTYGAERADSVRAAIDVSVSLGRVICVTDSEEAARRDDELLALSAQVGIQPIPPLPPFTCGVVRPGDPLAGALFPQGRVVASDGRARRFDDTVGVGWRLVVAGPGALPRREGDPRWFPELGGRVVGFAAQDVAVALQRPDFHLFGAAAGGGAADDLLDDLHAALPGPVPAPVGRSRGPDRGGAP
jgi:flavoprotein hydroxylase